ncbi:hypothetical protein M9H77_10234 [Catharanthus roseus]|uniref:Uncharacterized protein n=1 Tax=Catharanthus roseus TaxID=4058 RepID=A0ACC0C331_CATRO|nr:hypothetical protein M9H77_10234 [Catharanthus roseus]
MAGGVAQKLLEKLPNQRCLTIFSNRNPLVPLVTPPILQQSKSENQNLLINPDSGCSTGAESIPRHAFQFYPSFSFEYFLNPVSPCGFCHSQSLKESDESRVMWADSVKKKRKRKMNKHKLRKLRKRIRGHS